MKFFWGLPNTVTSGWRLEQHQTKGDGKWPFEHYCWRITKLKNNLGGKLSARPFPSDLVIADLIMYFLTSQKEEQSTKCPRDSSGIPPASILFVLNTFNKRYEKYTLETLYNLIIFDKGHTEQKKYQTLVNFGTWWLLATSLFLMIWPNYMKNVQFYSHLTTQYAPKYPKFPMYNYKLYR